MDNKDLDKLQKSNTIVYTFRWNKTKSRRLKLLRGVSFEEIAKSEFLGIEDHPNKHNQKLLICRFKDYIWVVPFVAEEKDLFLKTIYPSRKFKKIYQERS